jgi:FkbH-like protein
MSRQLRARVDHDIDAGNAAAAASGLAALLRLDPGPANASFVTTRFERLRGKLPMIGLRLAILRSFTVEPLVPLLRAQAFTAGIDLTVQLSDFNAYAQEILSSESRLYRFAPDVAILAVETRALAPELWPDVGGLDPGGGDVIADRVLEQLQALIAAFRRHSQGSLIVHNLEAPEMPAAGILDAQCGDGQMAALARIAKGLREAAAESHGIYVLDYEGLVARHGRRNWHDKKKWLTVRLPLRSAVLGYLAAEWLRFLLPLAGKTAKVLVTDLDNTLWGGVIGEEGLAGIRLDGEYPGAAYQALQRALLDLSRRGILLAVASKNNIADAMEALEKHPGMLLRPRHFAALRINWEDKTANLRAIAAELNLGLDTIAFLDDNPVERQRVREVLPEVMVLEPGEDPMDLAGVVREFAAFERLALSAEDRRRGEYYAAERQRAELQTASASREDFYYSLQQEADVALVTPATLGRVAQLTQKTNQFNLTTKRYTEQQIAELAARPDWQVWTIAVRDRYCDNGLVGVAITHDSGGVCEIDTFLLSCRVIGRTVETALAAHLVEQARQRGCRRVEGWFLPTKKNAPAREFYPNHGFAALAEDAGAVRWTLDLAAGGVESPAWILVQCAEATKEASALSRQG